MLDCRLEIQFLNLCFWAKNEENDWSWRESNPHLRDATAAHSHYATAPVTAFA